MTKSIYEWMEHPELLNSETLYELRSLLACYPYFQVVRLLYLKNLYILSDKSFEEELHRSSIYINERKVLFSILEGEKYLLSTGNEQPQKPAEKHTDRTGTLIDAFLSSNVDDTEKMKLSIEATTDYTSVLLGGGECETVDMRGQELIDNFVRQDSEPIKEKKEDTTDENIDEKEAESQDIEEDIDDEESYFTETLAKIYIKQGRYSKAIEIIKKLNLKYPKKNVYFADQIRFLEKLIINTKSK